MDQRVERWPTLLFRPAVEVHDDRGLPVCGVLGFGVERWTCQRCLVRLVGVSSGGVSNVILSTARFYAVVVRTVAARTVALVADDLRSRVANRRSSVTRATVRAATVRTTAA